MEISYNLRYQKSNLSSKLLLDKEGEIIIYAKGFRLKGKGAGDKGELINFSELKEFYYKNEKIFFVTFNKEKYTLFESGTLFDQLLIDIYKSRNEFLMDALFMKSGKIKAEFEADFQRMSKFNKMINKGHAKLRLYDRSLVVIPPSQDAFSIHFDFVDFYEFDELDYMLKIVADDGMHLFISKLGNDFELFQEKMEELLGGMYESIVNGTLKEAFPFFHAATLLKLAYKIKGGKSVNLKDIKKIDKELSDTLEQFIFEDESLKKHAEFLKSMTDESSIFYSISKDQAVSDNFVKWAMFAIPSKNVVVLSILPKWKNGNDKPNNQLVDFLFFRIIIEQGDPSQKVSDKISEIDQALVVLNFAKDPCYKDKRDLKHSPYQYAIRKLPFLRILRKSYIGKINTADQKEFEKQAEQMISASPDSRLKPTTFDKL